MTVKVLIDATAVQELLKQNPEIEVELARTAAAQIARALEKRLTDDGLEARVRDFLQGKLMESNWYQKRIAPQYQELLFQTMQAMASNFMNGITTGAQSTIIKKMVQEALTAEVPLFQKRMAEHIDRLIAERFAAFFSAKTPPGEPAADPS